MQIYGTNMRVIIGTPKDLQPPHFSEKVFVSQPYYKIIFENGFGLYVINSYKFSLIPRFFGELNKDFWEFGFYFAGWIFEIMWNKAFKR